MPAVLPRNKAPYPVFRRKESMSFGLGQTYSGYEFLSVANKTRTTVSYRVRNTLADRIELLHVLSQAGEADAQQRERFMREMGLRARLMHPNIPAFLNAMELKGHLVMTTEWVEGRTLAEMLQSGPLPVPEACRLMEQLLSALACAHEFGIVHRDISPESVVVTREGLVQVSSFGAAKGLSSPQLTQAGAIFGNAGYISPEQARGTSELDCRSDIYSAGSVLFHMLCGRPPFTAASEFELMVKHVKETPQPPGSFRAGIPQALDMAVLKALQKDPAQRYANCEEFAQALNPGTIAPEAMRMSEGRPPAPKRLVLYGALPVCAAVLLLIWFLVRK
jgi:serine/threonine-protein kinase